MSDEGFHEIQLNGKQLVFLFMAASVVAVVIFLCGVMVGRGVPIRAATTSRTSEQAELDPTASLQGLPVTQAVASDNAPVTAQETLTYPMLLEDPNPPFETLAPSVEPSADPPRVVAAAPRRSPTAAAKPATAAAPAASSPVAARAPAPKPAARPAPPVPRASATRGESSASPDASLTEPAGSGYVVQVAAVRQRAEATTIARRLSSKGYPAFVTTAGANFRVRVGKFDNRREAESVAGRLEREERVKPWITR
jgi:DedD protein